MGWAEGRREADVRRVQLPYYQVRQESQLDLCTGGGPCWTCVQGEVPVGLVCRGRSLLDLCAGGGYCWTCVRGGGGGEEGGDPCLTCVGGGPCWTCVRGGGGGGGGRSLFDLCGGEVPVGLVCGGEVPV